MYLNMPSGLPLLNRILDETFIQRFHCNDRNVSGSESGLSNSRASCFAAPQRMTSLNSRENLELRESGIECQLTFARSLFEALR